MEGQRESERVEIETALYILWEMADGPLGSGKITSLSRTGCFVQTKSEAQAGCGIAIRLRLPTERWMLLRGEITRVLRKVGFGVRFTELEFVDQEMLALLLEYYSEERVVHTAVICEPEPVGQNGSQQKTDEGGAGAKFSL